METLTMNSTSRFNHWHDDYKRTKFYMYEDCVPLDQRIRAIYEDASTLRTYSKRKETTITVRLERARKRHVFLSTYNLETTVSPKSSSKQLKAVIRKLKKVVIATVAIMRIEALRSCNCQSTIRASTPIQINKCF